MKKELMKELKDSGIRAAIRKLRRDYEYRDYCLFSADVAESVLPIFEAESDSKAPRLSVEGVRKWHRGEISDEELEALSDAACAAADYSSSDAAAYAAYSAADAGSAAIYDADAGSVFAAAAYNREWEEIEQIFMKHFGGSDD
jgi:hypothetical protein